MTEKKLELDLNTKRIFLEKIITYFSEERDEELGDLGAELLFNFVVENLGKEFYNKGIKDARKWLTGRFEELEEGLEYLYL